MALLCFLAFSNGAFPQSAFHNLAWFFTFLKPQPYRVLLVADAENVSLPAGLIGSVHITPPDGQPPEAAGFDFLTLGTLDSKSLAAWLDYGERNQIPALSIFAQGDVRRLLAWSGEGVKRNQIYVNQKQLESFAFDPQLPGVSAIHLVSWDSDRGPVCRTPRHFDCFPWK